MPEAANRVVPATPNPFGVNGIMAIQDREPATLKQPYLDLGIEVERSVRGVEMGVLENGIAFLTQRGLAHVAGAHRSTISDISDEWEKAANGDVIEPPSTRIGWLRGRLLDDEYSDSKLYIEVKRSGGPHWVRLFCVECYLTHS